MLKHESCNIEDGMAHKFKLRQRVRLTRSAYINNATDAGIACFSKRFSSPVDQLGANADWCPGSHDDGQRHGTHNGKASDG